MVKLAVIVSSYNRPRFIKEALDSIANQTIANQILVVVVDDGSIQEVRDIINSYSAKFAAFKLVSSIPIQDEAERTQTNRVAIGVNQGLRYIWGLHQTDRPDYISYLGDDDLYFSNRCEKMVSFLDENQDTFLVYHSMEIHQCDQEGNLIGKLLDLKEAWTEANKFWVEHIYNRIDHISFVHRDKNYLWEEDAAFRRASDWGFLLRALSMEEKFEHLPEYLAQGRKIKGDSINMEGSSSLRSKLAEKKGG